MSDRQGEGGAPTVQLWSRDGFMGQGFVVSPSNYSPDYVAAEGAHVPRRLVIDRLEPEDLHDPDALPTCIATSRIGVRLLLSARSTHMPFAVRNVEADEVHFIQSGDVLFETDVGQLHAGEGDFVFIPRAVAYRYGPRQGAMRSIILESPSPLRLSPPAPTGLINPARDVTYARIDPAADATGASRLILKASDGNTVFTMATDPLAIRAPLSGGVPVWKINLSDIQLHAYLPHGGPPSQFLSSLAGDVLLFNLSARPGGRAPIHVNADFDEVVVYVRGPGAWGACTEPGTVTCVPKGVLHHGPSEDVPEGYQAWLLETRATLRWTAAGLGASQMMETGSYGPHPGPCEERAHQG